VGSTDPVALNVHQGTLCRSSEYFKNLMKPVWASMRDDPHTVNLDNDCVSTVKAYVTWLYTDKVILDLDKILSNGEMKERIQEAEKAFVQLAKSYVYGEKIIDIMYKNMIVETIVKAISEIPRNMGSESVSIIYAGTPSGSPIRRLIADQAAYLAYDDSLYGPGWMTFFDGYPREALLDILKTMCRLRGSLTRDVKLSAAFIEPYLEKKGK
jgi:hypothetical protein